MLWTFPVVELKITLPTAVPLGYSEKVTPSSSADTVRVGSGAVAGWDVWLTVSPLAVVVDVVCGAGGVVETNSSEPEAAEKTNVVTAAGSVLEVALQITENVPLLENE